MKITDVPTATLQKALQATIRLAGPRSLSVAALQRELQRRAKRREPKGGKS